MRTACLLLALAAVLGAAGTAVAATPEVTTESGSGPIGPTCNGEDIIGTYTLTRRLQVTYDGSTPVLFRALESFSGTLYLASSGRSVPYSGSSMSTYDPATQTLTITGKKSIVTLPGGGAIAQDTGRVVIDFATGWPPTVTWHGQADSFAPGGLDALCAALGA
jgi:hypothetical protein